MLKHFLKEWDESKKGLAEIVVVIIISVRSVSNERSYI